MIEHRGYQPNHGELDSNNPPRVGSGLNKPEIPKQTIDVLSEIAAERASQDFKWGQQNHGAGTWLAILSEEVGEFSKAILEQQFPGSQGAIDENEIRDELKQVAAVAVAMIEAFDRGHCR